MQPTSWRGEGCYTERIDHLREYKLAGAHSKVRKLAEAILSDPQALGARECHEAARAGASAAMALRDINRATWFTERELSYARITGETELVLIGLYHHGTAVLQRGDHNAAIDALMEFVADARANDKVTRYMGAALFNLGVAVLQTKQYAEAIQWFTHSRNTCRDAEDHQGETRALLEIAWAELLADHAETAGYRLEEAAQLLHEYPDEHLEAVRRVHQAFYHYTLNEYQQALHLCQTVLDPPLSGAGPHQRSEAAWIAGECGLALGHVEGARRMADLATIEAIRAKWAALMNKANELKQKLRGHGETQGAL